MATAFCCAGCGRDFEWTSEIPLIGSYMVKTIASRYCVGCIDKEVVAHGISRERVIAMRISLGRQVP